MSLKNKVALSTDAGTNGKSALWLAMFAIYEMSDGATKHTLLGIWLICMVAINYLMRGSGLNASEGEELIDTSKDLKDVLGEGRE